ncbi:MAG TPA: methylated-DNA--[protein]-cysteine S-methyltransferase [Thermoplasmata archaeon]|nr:methylated-DNA--[protein]-cysteine S-methyltransferase [Thermoplasmata archaeon]
MTAYRVSLQAPAKGPIAELTKIHPGLCVEGTPVGSLLLLRLSGDSQTIDDAEETLATHMVTRHETKEADVLTLVVEAPPSEAGILERSAAAGALVLPPLRWCDSQVLVRLLLFDALRMDVLSAILPGAQLESKSVLHGNEVERELLASGLLLPSLTHRQGQAVLAALEAGYYDAPRKVTTGEVAQDLGIARSTFEEHLKAAESQLVRALAPVVRMRLLQEEQGSQAAGAEALHLYAKFSEDLGLFVNMTVRGDRIAAVSLDAKPPKLPHGEDHPYLARVLDHLATGRDDLQDIPLDLDVTPFEKEVLECLRTVPPGEVVTYGDLARLIGRPTASRAVGQVCAKNPAILVVPCHRVVPAAGGVGNYGGAGGPATKRKLLEKEGALPKVEGPRRRE